jgi:hypothetical protein
VASKIAENAKPKKQKNFICLPEHPKTMQGAKRQAWTELVTGYLESPATGSSTLRVKLEAHQHCDGTLNQALL